MGHRGQWVHKSATAIFQNDYDWCWSQHDSQIIYQIWNWLYSKFWNVMFENEIQFPLAPFVFFSLKHVRLTYLFHKTIKLVSVVNDIISVIHNFTELQLVFKKTYNTIHQMATKVATFPEGCHCHNVLFKNLQSVLKTACQWWESFSINLYISLTHWPLGNFKKIWDM